TSSNVQDGKATYVGSCADGICSWKGIRYASPPIGNQRFSPAKVPASLTGTVDATEYGPTCLQSGDGRQSEDCLFANVFRPSGVSLNKKLPVLIFVHGGGFQSGAGSEHDPSQMILAGGNDLQAVVITINYRLGLFGFLGGSTFAQRQKQNRNDVTLNAAFTDVVQAINWSSDHIAAFGGDPDKITLWGQSAGSFASAAVMLGKHTSPKFKGVILESGSPGGVPIDPASRKDGQFNTVVSSAGCSGNPDVIGCLRGASASNLLQISNLQANLNGNVNTIPRGYYAWTAVQDGGPSNGGFFSDRPSQVINAGKFANVPVLHGDCYDEGTYFADQDSNNTQETFDYFRRIYFDSDELLQEALQQYPDDPVVGSPYKPHDGDYSNRFYGATNQYKRISSLYGDIRYQSNRRFFLDAIANRGTTAYSYEFAQYVPGNADSLGYPHGSDLDYVFNIQDGNPFGTTLSRQWLSFAAYQTPNKAGNGSPLWKHYTANSPKLLYYANNTITTIDDTFRKGPMDFL
ncbi:alpha/beta-hydrolase, partial [Meira miltonrushii]